MTFVSPLKIGALVWVQFLVLTINFRMIALGHIPGAVITDGIIAFLGWTLVKRIAEATTVPERCGYIIGAMLGSVSGILITRLGGF